MLKKNLKPPPAVKLYPTPDPLLLLAKAALVWGKLTGVDVLPNGADSDEDSFGDLYADDDYYEDSSDDSFEKIVILIGSNKSTEQDNLSLNGIPWSSLRKTYNYVRLFS